MKLHTLLDLRGNIPTVVIITHGKVHEINILDQLSFEAGAFYVMDRGYLDFRALVQVAPGRQLLCYSRQKALQFPAPLLTTRRSSYGSDLRSDSDARQFCSPARLSREAPSHSLPRCANRSTTRLSHQQLQLATTDYRRTISQPLASGVILQVDQTTSAHQEFLRHFRERFADSNLDRDLRLCARGHRQKGVAPREQSLQNVTDLQRHAFRENPHFTSSFAGRRPNRLGPSLQTTDSVQLTLGQY